MKIWTKIGIVLVAVLAFVVIRTIVFGIETRSEAKNYVASDVAHIIKKTDGYSALIKYYPEEAEYLIDELTILYNSDLNQKEYFNKTVSISSEIRRRHAPHLRTAPDASLKAVLANQLQIQRAYENDPAVCNRLLMYGPEALSQRELSKVLRFTDTSDLLYKAMLEGETNPIERGVFGSADLDKLVTEFLISGATDDELELVLKPVQDDDKTCSANIKFGQFVLDASFEGADLLRAESVRAMFGI